MKCELCHKCDAETAIQVEKDGGAEELYVCKSCAKAQRVEAKKAKMCSRAKPQDEGEGEEDSVLSALQGITDVIGEFAKHVEERCAAYNEARKTATRTMPCTGIGKEYVIGDRLHLEGLCLIGEIEAVTRAVSILGLELEGMRAGTWSDIGHAYHLKYFDNANAELANRVLADILIQESNARKRLLSDMPRVLGDAVLRSLAVLKNCRMVSPAEVYDLLSPLRLAQLAKLLDGITLKRIERLMSEMERTVELEGSKAYGEGVAVDYDVDLRDEELADSMNEKFEDVVVSEHAEVLGL